MSDASKIKIFYYKKGNGQQAIKSNLLFALPIWIKMRAHDNNEDFIS